MSLQEYTTINYGEFRFVVQDWINTILDFYRP